MTRNNDKISTDIMHIFKVLKGHKHQDEGRKEKYRNDSRSSTLLFLLSFCRHGDNHDLAECCHRQTSESEQMESEGWVQSGPRGPLVYIRHGGRQGSETQIHNGGDSGGSCFCHRFPSKRVKMCFMIKAFDRTKLSLFKLSRVSRSTIQAKLKAMSASYKEAEELFFFFFSPVWSKTR